MKIKFPSTTILLNGIFSNLSISFLRTSRQFYLSIQKEPASYRVWITALPFINTIFKFSLLFNLEIGARLQVGTVSVFQVGHSRGSWMNLDDNG